MWFSFRRSTVPLIRSQTGGGRGGGIVPQPQEQQEWGGVGVGLPFSRVFFKPVFPLSFQGGCLKSESSERVLFLTVLETVLDNCSSDEFLFPGTDFNCTEKPRLDRNNRELYAASRQVVLSLCETFELCDMWRWFYPAQQQFT